MAFEPLEARRLLAVLTVNSVADNTIAGDGLVTLREAIQAANTNTATDLQEVASGADEIRFAAALNGATIFLTAGEIYVTEALTIDATALAGGLTINAQRQSRILNITAESGDFTIAGLTLTGGRTTDANSPSAGPGGAIRSLTSGDLNIIASTISGSHTEGDAAHGGGIYARGDVTLTRSAVTGNNTDGDHAEGGGIHSLGDVLLINSTVSGNFTKGSSARGGGLYARGSVTLDHSHVRVNHTQGTFSAGAGIAAGDVEGGFGAVTVFNSTVSGNFTVGSAAYGAGIAAWGPVEILHSDVIYNIAFNPAPVGGGVWTHNDAIGIANSIVAFNVAAGGSPDVRPGGALHVAFSLIGNNSGTQLLAAPVGSPDANGNLIGTVVTPIDPLLGPHADNGGPTITHALLLGSPAIDAGDPNAAAGVGGVPQFDQRGAGFSRVGGSRIDMGAFEVQVETPDDPDPPDDPGGPGGNQGGGGGGGENPGNALPIAAFVLGGPASGQRLAGPAAAALSVPANTPQEPIPFNSERLGFSESDGGAGGGMPADDDAFGPRSESDAEQELRELLSKARIATREEVIDAVYSLGDMERISLVGFDMGDEPLAARKKQETKREAADIPSPVVVNKPTTDLVAQDDTGWGPLAIWSALAGGGTLWMGGAWWWLGRSRRRAALQASEIS